VFLKEYGETKAGKDAMISGVGAFNKAASRAYEVLSIQEKEQLQKRAESIEKNTPFTSIDIRHRAASVFKKIRNQFRELQEYGYYAVAYGFHEGFSEIAYTTNCSLCADPAVV
jgi:hypothetical protein